MTVLLLKFPNDLVCNLSVRRWDITGGTLDIVIVPVLAGSDALLGSVVFDTLQSLQLKVCTDSAL